MAEKEPTKEEKEADFKKMQDLQMQALISNSGIIGSNYAKANGGDLGDLSASAYMNSDDILKIKQNIHTQTIQEYKQAGIAYDVPFPTDGVLAMNSTKIVRGAMSELTLGNLEKIVNTVDPTKAGIKVSDKFKGLTGKAVSEIIEKAGDKLSGEVEDLYNTYVLLNSSYNKASAMNVMTKNYLSQEKAVLNQIFEKYKPKEDKKGK